MSPTKPVFVLVPGGWHTAHHYKPFVDVLESRGYEVLALNLPSIADETPADPVGDDIRLVADTSRALSDQGKEVVIIGHSCGGIATAEGATGLGKRERSAKDLPGGVRSIVVVAGMVRPAGDPPKWSPWKEQNTFVENDLLVFKPEADLVQSFFHDVPKELRPKRDELAKHPNACGEYVMKNPAYSEVDNVFIYCDEDYCFTPQGQRFVVNGMKERGVEFREAFLPSGHFPFLSMPDKLADEIIKIM